MCVDAGGNRAFVYIGNEYITGTGYPQVVMNPLTSTMQTLSRSQDDTRRT